MTDQKQPDREDALDIAAQKIADVRADCMQLSLKPKDISQIMLDEAVLGLMASGYKLSEIQSFFKKYERSKLPKFYMALRKYSQTSLN